MSVVIAIDLLAKALAPNALALPRMAARTEARNVDAERPFFKSSLTLGLSVGTVRSDFGLRPLCDLAHSPGKLVPLRFVMSVTTCVGD